MKKSEKTLFFDIDGTLFAVSPSTVPDSARRALKMAQENGHLIFINTGRTFHMIPEIIKELGFDGYVCGCGSQIYLHGEVLHSSVINHELCMQIMELLRTCKISAFFEQHNGIFYDGSADFTTDKIERLKQALSMSDFTTFSKEWKASCTFAKFLAISHDFSDTETFLRFCENKFHCFRHNPRVWEVAQKEYSKATGMEFLLKHLGLSREHSYAFGDSVNDLSMLQYAGTSVAMGNCMKEILPHCDYQTTDILEDGIHHAMEHFGLI